MTDFIVNDWVTAVSAILAVVGWVVALTPTQYDDTVMERVRNLWTLFRRFGR